MLIQIIFFILMLLGVAALIVDMGIAGLTQSQMQNAADTAALEGLRQRDAEMFSVNDPTRGTWDDKQRREYAASLINGREAGPVLQFRGAGLAGELNAAQTLDAAATTTYMPTLQTNVDNNHPHGDMVAGQYDPSGGHTESQDYTRGDFTPSAPVLTGTSLARAFLVRLRRTNDFQGLDNVTNVSSGAGPLPLLFGRGTFIHGDTVNNPNNYNPRVHGITVRAAAIANVMKVMRVGPAAHGLHGATTFFVDQSTWAAFLANGNMICLKSDPSDSTHLIDSGDPSISASFFTAAAYPLATGQALNITAQASAIVSGIGYVPVYSGSAIVGFGFVSITQSGEPGYSCPAGSLFQLQGTPLGVAPDNASATPFPGMQRVPDTFPGSLMAPVLAR